MTPTDAAQAAAALTAAGIADHDITILRGDEGAARLDGTGASHGRLARTRRLVSFKLAGARVAIQGFGNVGEATARLLRADGARNHLELMARLRALLRRLSMPAPVSRAPSFRARDIEVDFAAHEADSAGSGWT